MNRNLVMMGVSEWLNDYKKKNNLRPEEIAKELDSSFGYIELLLDYKNHPGKYKTFNIPIQFLSKLIDTYNITIDEILEKNEEYKEAKANNEKIIKLVNVFREKLIGQSFNVDVIKSEIPNEIVINDVCENGNLVIFETDYITMMEMEVQRSVNKFGIILQDNIIKYFILEQESLGPVLTSQKQRYYFDKENELFVSSVKLENVQMLFDMNYETMMKFNNRFFYQDRYKESDEAINFNNKILDEIINGKSLEEIKEFYNNMDQEEEEEPENDM